MNNSTIKPTGQSLRAVAKALNQAGWMSARSFYMGGERYTQARVSKGDLQVRFCHSGWIIVTARPVCFDDGQGRIIANLRPSA